MSRDGGHVRMLKPPVEVEQGFITPLTFAVPAIIKVPYLGTRQDKTSRGHCSQQGMRNPL